MENRSAEHDTRSISCKNKSSARQGQPWDRLRKKDVIFIGILLFISLLLLLWFLLGYRKTGSSIEITVDGELYGTYALNEDQEIFIRVDGAVTNLLLIEDGQANMREADCPDQICVNHASISHTGENIVCLPNRVVVSVIGEKAQELDSVVR